MEAIVFLAVIVGIIAWTMNVMSSKGYGKGIGFALGFFGGIIGVVIAYCLPTKEAK